MTCGTDADAVEPAEPETDARMHCDEGYPVDRPFEVLLKQRTTVHTPVAPERIEQLSCSFLTSPGQ
jgi:hypothetical protein